MKNLILTGIAALFFATMTLAQAPPQGVNYQAVAYDTKSSEIPGTDVSSLPLANKAIKVRFTIIKDQANGNEVYSEEHTTETDENGLFNLIIGKGFQTSTTGFPSIDWGTGLHFLKVDLAVSGSFNTMGTQQIWSVPYALYTEKAGNGVEQITDNGGTSITFTLANGETFNVPLNGGVGSQGPAGNDGADGAPGAQGPAGPAGSAGTDGISIEWLTTVTAPTNPTLNQAYYNAADKVSYIWNGTAWQIVAKDGADGTGGPAGAHNTLNQAYNEGGAGAGRTITANNGPVEINHTTSGTRGLIVTTNQTNALGIDAINSGTGVAISGKNTNAANNYPAIQAGSNSTNPDVTAIFGSNDGAGYGILGQVEATGTGSAGVFGFNLRTNGGFGVLGKGVNGVVGESNHPGGYGIYGLNTSLTGNAVGTYGKGLTGVYGETIDGEGYGVFGSNTGTTDLAIGTVGIGYVGLYGETNDFVNGFAGLFTGDVYIDGDITADNLASPSDERLKSNILPIENALNKIMQLKPKHYTIKTQSTLSIKDGQVVIKERQEYGVIAQDLELIFPEMISERAIFKSSGDDTEYKTVYYMQLIPVLIEAVKELKNEVDVLRDELETLKNK